MTDVFNKRKAIVHILTVYYSNIRTGSIWENRFTIPFAIRMHSMNVSGSVWSQKKMRENLSGMNIIKGMTTIRYTSF